MTSTSQGLCAVETTAGGLIRPPGFGGALFGTAVHGDVRRSAAAVAHFTAAGAPEHFAYANQVHGSEMRHAMLPGPVGDADAIVTTVPNLAVTVATADCVPVILEASGFAAVVHAGWRGLAAGVVSATIERLQAMELRPVRAAIGPAVGACCYEVGPEVTAALPAHTAETTWGTASVDLVGAATAQLGPVPVWVAARCTMEDEELFSHRRDRTRGRQVAVAWLPDV